MKPSSFCVSITSKRKPSADQLARVAHLAAAFAVERRLIEHDDDRLLVADLRRSASHSLILGHDADHLRLGAPVVS